MKVRKNHQGQTIAGQGHGQVVIAKVKEQPHHLQQQVALPIGRLLNHQNGQITIANSQTMLPQTTLPQMNHSQGIVVSPLTQTPGVAQDSVKTDVLLSNVHLVSALQSPIIWHQSDGILRQALMGSEKALKVDEKAGGMATDTVLTSEQIVPSSTATLVTISMAPQTQQLFTTSSLPPQVIMVGELGTNQIILTGPGLAQDSASTGEVDVSKQLSVETTRIDLEQTAPNLLVIDDQGTFDTLNVNAADGAPGEFDLSVSVAGRPVKKPTKIRRGRSINNLVGDSLITLAPADVTNGADMKADLPPLRHDLYVGAPPDHHADDHQDIRLMSAHHDAHDHHDDMLRDLHDEVMSLSQQNPVGGVEHHSADGNGELGYTAHLLSQLSGTGALPTMSSSQVSSVLSALEPTDKSSAHPSSLATSLDGIVASKQRKLPVKNEIQPTEFVKIESSLKVADTSKLVQEKVLAKPPTKPPALIQPRSNVIVLRAANSAAKEVGIFKCANCEFLSVKESSVDLHHKRVHAMKETSADHTVRRRTIKCVGCSNVFFSKHALQVHLIQDHEVYAAEVTKMLGAITSNSQQAAKQVESDDLQDKNCSPGISAETDSGMCMVQLSAAASAATVLPLSEPVCVSPAQPPGQSLFDHVTGGSACDRIVTPTGLPMPHPLTATTTGLPMPHLLTATTTVMQPLMTVAQTMPMVISSCSPAVAPAATLIDATTKTGRSSAPPYSVYANSTPYIVHEEVPPDDIRVTEENRLVKEQEDRLKDEDDAGGTVPLAGTVATTTDPTTPVAAAVDSSAAVKTNRAEAANPAGGEVQRKRGRPRGSQTLRLVRTKYKSNEVKLEKDLVSRCGIDGCAVRMQSEANMIYHRRCHGGGGGGAAGTDGKAANVLSCPECALLACQWSSLASHLWKEHKIDMELYSCAQCGYKTHSYSKLVNLHNRIHGEERPFLCDLCGKGFKTPKQLRNHKVLHKNQIAANNSEAQPLSCNICGRKVSDARNLRHHTENVHNKSRPYHCTFCGYMTSSRSSLIMHSRQHTGEKPFKCENCDYVTADHNSLRRHKMLHSGNKPYSCPHCPYACIQSTTYKTHLKNKHPGLDEGLMFSCPDCPFRTIKKDNFLAHQAQHKLNGGGAVEANRQRGRKPHPAVGQNGQRLDGGPQQQQRTVTLASSDESMAGRATMTTHLVNVVSMDNTMALQNLVKHVSASILPSDRLETLITADTPIDLHQEPTPVSLKVAEMSHALSHTHTAAQLPVSGLAHGEIVISDHINLEDSDAESMTGEMIVPESQEDR